MGGGLAAQWALGVAGYLLCALPRSPRRGALLPPALVLVGGLAGGVAVLPPADLATRPVAAAWLLDRAAPPESYYDQDRAVTGSAWAALRKLPQAAQRDRVAALRAASVRCRSDVYEVLLGGR